MLEYFMLMLLLELLMYKNKKKIREMKERKKYFDLE